MALEDVYILETKIKGPAQLAVFLAQLAKRKKNPVTEACLVWIDSENKPGIAFTELTNSDLLQLEKYLHFVNEDIYREAWHNELIQIWDYEEE